MCIRDSPKRGEPLAAVDDIGKFDGHFFLACHRILIQDQLLQLIVDVYKRQDLYKSGFYNANRAGNAITASDSANILFETMMGVKYLVSDGAAPAGYSPAGRTDSGVLYKNDAVLPLGYARSAVMGQEEFGRDVYKRQILKLLIKSVHIAVNRFFVDGLLLDGKYAVDVNRYIGKRVPQFLNPRLVGFFTAAAVSAVIFQIVHADGDEHRFGGEGDCGLYFIGGRPGGRCV